MSKLAIIDPVGSKAGMDRYDFRLAEALRRLRVPVLVFTDVPDPVQSRPAVFRLNVRPRGWSFIMTLLSFLKAVRYCRKERVTHVLFHVYAFSAADEWMLGRIRANGFRTIVLVHDVESFIGEVSPARRRRIVHELSDHLLVHNQHTAEELRALTGRTEGISVIPHGHFIETDYPRPVRAFSRRSLGIPADAYCPLFFGMIKPTKGLSILCAAMDVLPADVVLLVAGRPRGAVDKELMELERLRQAGRALVKAVFIPEKEMEVWMAAADCVVVPYARSYQSGVAIQAMSRGIPVVLSDLPVHRDWVNSGATAQLFVSGDKDHLARAILRLKESPEASLRIADAARNHLFRSHAWELPAGIIRNLLQDA